MSEHKKSGSTTKRVAITSASGLVEIRVIRENAIAVELEIVNVSDGAAVSVVLPESGVDEHGRILADYYVEILEILGSLEALIVPKGYPEIRPA